ncbi:MAG: hypothetical protein H7837_14260 [Magnetococcus sp. MYC-9]
MYAKRWLVLILWLAVGLRGQPAWSEREPLAVWDDALGVRLLSSAWLLLEKEVGNTRIRVYRMETGKVPCPYEPGRRDCEFEQLAIGLATTGEHPMRRLYLTPRVEFWRYPTIVQLVDVACPGNVIRMTAREIGDTEYGSPGERRRQRTLFVNLHEAYLQ